MGGYLQKLFATQPMPRKEARDARYDSREGEILADSSLSRRQKKGLLYELARAFLDGKEIGVKEGGIFAPLGVKPGHAGPMIHGNKVMPGVRGSGAHWGLPGFSKVEQFDLRVQRYDFTLPVITKSRLRAEVDVFVLHRISESAVRQVFLSVGKEYDKKLIEPILIHIARKLAFDKTDEEVMNPAFGEELTDMVHPEFEEMGLSVTLSIKDTRVASAVSQAYGEIAKTGYEKLKIDAVIAIFEPKATLLFMQTFLQYDVKIIETELEANIQRMIQQVGVDIEKQKRQPDYFSAEYFRDLVIKSGWGAIGMDAVSNVADRLAEAFADLLARR